MPPGAAPGADVPVPRRDGPARWEIPFWALQVVELGVAVLLVTQSVHVGHAGLLIALGAVLAALAVTADGPLGIDRICSQRLHCVLVVAVAVAAVVLAFLPAVGPDAEGVLMIVAAAAALVFLVTRTTADRGPRRASPAGASLHHRAGHRRHGDGRPPGRRTGRRGAGRGPRCGHRAATRRTQRRLGGGGRQAGRGRAPAPGRGPGPADPPRGGAPRRTPHPAPAATRSTHLSGRARWGRNVRPGTRAFAARSRVVAQLLNCPRTPLV